MRDPIAIDRELQRLLEETTGIAQMREVEEQIRRMVEPFREPYVTGFERMLAEAKQQEKWFDDATRGFARPTAFEVKPAVSTPQE